MRLAQAMDQFALARRTEVEEGTLAVYRYTLGKLLSYLGDVELSQIKVDDLRRWRAGLAEGELSVYTLHRDVRQTRKFFNWCVDEGYLEYSPAARLALPRLPRGEPPKAISDQDLERMIERAQALVRAGPAGELKKGQKQTYWLTVRDYAIVRFLAETGCRVGGLVTLRAGDLDLEGGEATVREKGRKTRAVNFGPATAQALRLWLLLRPRNKWEDVVFVGERGKMTGSGVYRILQRLAVEAGVEGRHNPHSFRHALARRLLKNKADMGTVADILGHSDVETTFRFYARWSKSELAERHRQFGGILE